MVRSALPSLPLDELDLVVIENVGNLVCPAEFRVGEDARVMVSSVTEGEEKPLKYPLMFRACDLVARQQDRPASAPRFRPGALPREPRRGAPRRAARCSSARNGEGIDAWRDWLVRHRVEAARPCMIEERTRANDRFFAAESERIARLCRCWRLGSRMVAACSPSGRPRRRSRTRGTSRSSSSTR